MKKYALTLLVLLITAALMLAGCGNNDSITNNSNEMTVTDLLGRTVTIPVDAEKFIAIGAGCLRLYCYVGDVSKIVGVEQIEVTNGTIGRPYIKANEELLDLPIVGPGGPNNAPDPEKILELAPDVIFTLYNSDAASVDELQNKTQIPVIALSYGDTEVFDPQLTRSIEIIGEVTGEEERVAEVIAFFNECQEDLASRTADIAEQDKPRVYLGGQSMRGTHGIESTSGSFSLFMATNVFNVVDEAGIHEYVMLDKEKLLEMDPDIIFIDAGALANVQEDYNSNPLFYEALKAFESGQVYMLLPYNYYYANIDIALCDAYYIGSIVYPEKFKDVDVVAKSNEIFKKLLGKELYNEVAGEYYGGFQQLIFN